MKIVADDKIPFLKGVLEPFADVVYLPGKEIKPSDVKDADALLTRTRTKCNAELLQGSKVKFIATATIGFDHIDTNYCDQKGIRWTNAPGCNSSSVQQYIAAVLLYLSQKKGFDLKDRTLGIVGVGNVGNKVLKLAEILGMRIYLNDPPRERAEGHCGFVSLNGIIRECDIITFHVPLYKDGVDKTIHLANENLLKVLYKDTILINSSRGEVVDNKALKDVLGSGKISGAVLDVWEGEPALDKELMDMVDIATPHIAGYSADGKANGTAMSVNALCEFFNLPYKNWYPEDVPEPDNTFIEINCKGKSDQEILHDAVLATYPIWEDDERLRNSVDTFEKQRGDYPLRREFKAYTVKLENNSSKDIIIKLNKLGFKTI
ncbi:MAG: 4-phosphoerythronate dehydrogenase PdxB [Bacteroidales bacterium]|nr:4-phosphoerythronate dehydrogenase PdxB [Bacteroidales bacterium]